MKDKKPLSNAERQAARRTRLSHGGLFKRRDFFVHPEDEPTLRKEEARLRRLRLREREGNPV